MKAHGELHWMIAAGVLLILLSIMICVVIFVLPVFDEQRTAVFWFGAMPIAVIGALMILYRHRRG